MPTHYPIVFEREDSGVFSAYVAGLPVYDRARHAVRWRAQSFGHCAPISMRIRRTSRARRYRSPEWRLLHAATRARR